jgi:hypothetical protein
MKLIRKRKATERRIYRGFNEKWNGSGLEANDQFIFVLTEAFGYHRAAQFGIKRSTELPEKIVVVMHEEPN